MERRIGVHISIAGGIDKGLERARDLGCSSVQMFSHNPRGWELAKRSPEEIMRFRELKQEFDLSPVVIHTSYLINLASSRTELFDKSVRMVIQELDIADEIDAEYVVLHTGSASGDLPAAARARAVEALKQVAGQGRWKAGLLLENTAGERGDITSHMADIAGIIEKVSSDLIAGLCLDTCHAFAAGYDIATEKGIEGLAQEIGKYMSKEHLRLIHLNDSKKPMGSGVDRHEHIGEGTIGRTGLRKFLLHPFFPNIPLILETPKKTEEDDPRNLTAVRMLLTQPSF
ncbi:MAG: deoxyribonuclease IV [Nitrospirae bacterium]|nr:deoxyribonuclease IV [Nitrospirota bacterium]